ncbi:sensor histidine kinase [Nonomuraea turkmeniaca]|uniref:Sensor histidine kinase n=1 Tax=Nonomuraea turkmeniaca TaxID=103838 RepID=A0A5S4FGB5_9ACTN|nr:histidine kinase [Nonomuraea turkmeniaca]TMR18338.1 sensor histidine kinase [Nonomuraea turkmeniaca]
MRGLLGRVRRASKLDKVRWLIIGSTDIVLLLPLFGYVDLVVRWQTGILPWPLGVAAAVLLLVFNVLSTRPFAIAIRGGKRPTAILAVTGVIVVLLSVFPLFWTIPTWLALMTAFVSKRIVIALSVASIVVINLYITLFSGFVLVVLLIQTLYTVICVGAVWANLRLWQLAKEAHEGQEALARLAVSEERLRFARDLNDLLGQSLTDVAARAAHAEQALRADPGAAAAEMFEVRDLARQSLREVRTVVQNYRAIDLDEVLASVRAVLEAADVRCTVRADTASLTPETRTLLATVVREGATNVLKHSRAERCTITIEDGVLEMSNDGVSGPVGEHAPNGLAGLAERVRAAGGTLQAEPTREGRYLLRAAVPA